MLGRTMHRHDPLLLATAAADRSTEPMPLAAAWGLGLLLFFGGALLAYLAVLSWMGRLERNRAVGIRIRSTMANDQAWTAGHRAAAPWLGVASLGVLLPGAIVLLRPSNQTGQLVILVGVGLLVGMVAVAAFMANQAATECSSDEP